MIESTLQELDKLNSSILCHELVHIFETLAPLEEESSLPPLLSERPPKGSITNRVWIEECGVDRLTLSNKATVWLKPTDFKGSEILFNQIQPGGERSLSEAEIDAFRFASPLISQYVPPALTYE